MSRILSAVLGLTSRSTKYRTKPMAASFRIHRASPKRPPRMPKRMLSATNASAAKIAKPRMLLNMGASLRSEEHTSELQSRLHLVCRLLLEKKKKNKKHSMLTKAQNTEE